MTELNPIPKRTLVDVTGSKYYKNFTGKPITTKDIKDMAVTSLAVNAPEKVALLGGLGLASAMINPIIGSVVTALGAYGIASTAHNYAIRKKMEGNDKFHHELLNKQIEYARLSDFGQGFGDAVTYNLADNKMKFLSESETTDIPFIGKMNIKKTAGEILGTLAMDALATMAMGGATGGKGLSMALSRAFVPASSINSGIRKYIEKDKQGLDFENALKSALITTGSEAVLGHLLINKVPKLYMNMRSDLTAKTLRGTVLRAVDKTGADVAADALAWSEGIKYSEKILRHFAGLEKEEEIPLSSNLLLAGALGGIASIARTPKMFRDFYKNAKYSKMTDEQLINKTKIPKAEKFPDDYYDEWFIRDLKDFTPPKSFLKLDDEKIDFAYKYALEKIAIEKVDSEFASLEALKELARMYGPEYNTKENYKQILKKVDPWKN